MEAVKEEETAELRVSRWQNMMLALELRDAREFECPWCACSYLEEDVCYRLEAESGTAVICPECAEVYFEEGAEAFLQIPEECHE